MTTHVQDALMAAVSELDPEQAERALEAFDDPIRRGPIHPLDNWWDGPLARAYGKRGVLADVLLDARLEADRPWYEGDEYEVAAGGLGISVTAAIEIEESFAWAPRRQALKAALQARADEGAADV